MILDLIEFDIKGVFLLKHQSSYDERGFFTKDYEYQSHYSNLNVEIKETFVSFSRSNVLRGLHFQINKPQLKIVRCLTGEIYDVIVDLRNNSNTFGKYLIIHLNYSKHESLYIPKGCAHGFYAIQDSLISYKCDELYNKSTDTGIVYNDDILDIKWPKINNPIISKRDLSLPRFDPNKTYFSNLL
jgi:dTDP-4-dehydrorhamnose 3,5-epimerase